MEVGCRHSDDATAEVAITACSPRSAKLLRFVHPLTKPNRELRSVDFTDHFAAESGFRHRKVFRMKLRLRGPRK